MKLTRFSGFAEPKREKEENRLYSSSCCCEAGLVGQSELRLEVLRAANGFEFTFTLVGLNVEKGEPELAWVLGLGIQLNKLFFLCFDANRSLPGFPF